jgi:hypothetical protein
VLGLSIALAMSFLTTVGGTIAYLVIFERKPLPSSIRFCSLIALLLASIRYDTGFHVCNLMNSTKPFVILWAAPVSILWILLSPFSSDSNDLQLAFDTAVLAFIIYNSLSNPRSLETTLRRVLYRNGILFFLVSIRRHRAIHCACSLRPSWLH